MVDGIALACDVAAAGLRMDRGSHALDENEGKERGWHVRRMLIGQD